MGWGLKAPARGAESRHCMVRRVAGWGICAALALGALLPGPAAAAPRKQLRPFRVRRASLTQGGRLLYWRVTLNHSFSVTTFKDEHRSLCLLLEGPAHGYLSGRLCLVAGAHPGDGPRL